MNSDIERKKKKISFSSWDDHGHKLGDFRGKTTHELSGATHYDRSGLSYSYLSLLSDLFNLVLPFFNCPTLVVAWKGTMETVSTRT